VANSRFFPRYQDYGAIIFRPFSDYNRRVGWSFSDEPQLSADWMASPGERWLVSAGGGVGKAFALGRQNAVFSAFGYRNVARPTVLPEPYAHQHSHHPAAPRAQTPYCSNGCRKTQEFARSSRADTLESPRELTSIPGWLNLWIALPVTGSRMLDDTAPEGLSCPQTNALAASALKWVDRFGQT
jgi:hypothetical protein